MTDSTSSTHRAATYRCERCDENRTSTVCEGEDRICLSCGDVVCRIYLCHTCDQREATHGADDCLECIADAVVADVRELDCCTDDLQREVAKVLAARLKPFLTVRQAA